MFCSGLGFSKIPPPLRGVGTMLAAVPGLEVLGSHIDHNIPLVAVASAAGIAGRVDEVVIVGDVAADVVAVVS